jgi:hypothetical protein
MAPTHLTARNSTGPKPTGQLAPWELPELPEPQHDSPTHASQEEEPFKIKLVVLGSPTAQGTPTEKPQQQQDHDVDKEDDDDEEYSPLSHNEGKKLYRDADERESFGAEARSPPVGFVLYWDTWASPPSQDIGLRESHIQGRWYSRQLQRSSLGLGSSTGTRGQPSEHLSVMLWLMSRGRPSLLEAIATRMSCRTPSTASCLSERRTNSRPLG